MFRPFWFIVTIFAMLCAAFLVARLILIATGSSISLIPVAGAAVVIAALLEGHNYARINKVWPGRNLIWLAALSMTAIAALLADGVYALLILTESRFAYSLSEIDPPVFGLSIVVLAGVTCIVLRFSYEAGLKMVMDRRPG